MVLVDVAALEAAILDAHERHDAEELTILYQSAATLKHNEGDINAYWFLMTHAYVFALECGHTDATHLHEALKTGGRDE